MSESNSCIEKSKNYNLYSNIRHVELLLKEQENLFKPYLVFSGDDHKNLLLCYDRYRTLDRVIIFHIFIWKAFRIKIDQKAQVWNMVTWRCNKGIHTAKMNIIELFISGTYRRFRVGIKYMRTSQKYICFFVLLLFEKIC